MDADGKRTNRTRTKGAAAVKAPAGCAAASCRVLPASHGVDRVMGRDRWAPAAWPPLI
jgi:hypothetical protein